MVACAVGNQMATPGEHYYDDPGCNKILLHKHKMRCDAAMIPVSKVAI
jgi:hypothetical protein